MSVLSAKFPVYQLRQFSSIQYEGSLVLLNTYFNRYVLDDKSLAGDYFERRLHISIHEKEYPYKLYPLKARCTHIAQVLHLVQKSKHFIGHDGVLFKYKKHKRFTIRTFPVVNICEKDYKKYLVTIKIDALTHINMVVERPCDYVQLVLLSTKSFLLYNTCNTHVKDFWRMF